MWSGHLERRLVAAALSRLRAGRIVVHFWDGAHREYGGQGPTVSVRIRTPAVVRAAVRDPSMALGEGYARGDVEVPEDQLETLFRQVERNLPDLTGPTPWWRGHRHAPARRGRQRGHISRHYDVGNDYYRLLLDPTLTYSCGYFATPDDSLADAQRRKVEHLLRKLAPRPGERILDIGSGWGYLAVAAARDHGASVLGITLSAEQLAGARELARKEGVEDRVGFELCNYQELPNDPLRGRYADADGRFDRIISVGMFEHVGRGQQRRYVQVVRELLAEAGTSVLHTVTRQHSGRTNSWVDKHIFPGGALPTVAEVEAELAAHGLWSIDRENLWAHYARTLECWRANHRAHRAEITERFGAEFYRTRDLWLASARVGFEVGDLGLNQFVFTKGKPVDWSATRGYLYSRARGPAAPRSAAPGSAAHGRAALDPAAAEPAVREPAVREPGVGAPAAAGPR